MGQYFAPLLKKSHGTPRIVNVSSGAGSIGSRLDRSGGMGTNIKAIPYRASKAAMNMVSACQLFEFEEHGFKVFTYCPGFTASNLSEHNKIELGAKPTGEGAAPMVEMLMGKRDGDVGKFLKHGMESFPW